MAAKTVAKKTTAPVTPMEGKILIEDFERISLLDTVYLYEDQEKRRQDAEWWQWISEHEGRIIVEKDEETGEERKEIVISNALLPF